MVEDIPFASFSSSFGQRKEVTAPPTTPRCRQECVAIGCRCEESGASAQQRTYQRDSPVTEPPGESEALVGKTTAGRLSMSLVSESLMHRAVGIL